MPAENLATLRNSARAWAVVLVAAAAVMTFAVVVLSNLDAPTAQPGDLPTATYRPELPSATVTTTGFLP